jgi:hypothetical protein
MLVGDMLDRRDEDNSGLLFSPQPKPEPDMHGARNVDSVLFDVAQLQQAARDVGAQEPGQGSGLVDVAKLVPSDDDAAVEPAAALVEEINARPEPPEPTRSDPRGLLITTILLALCLLGGLAWVALR